MDQIPQNYGDMDYDPLYPYGYGLNSFEDSEFGSAPVLNSALLDETGKAIELSFNKSMNNNGNTEAQFYILNNGIEIGATNFYLSLFDEKRIVIQLSELISEINNLNVSYISGNLAAADGGILNTFNNINVIDFANGSTGLHSLLVE